MENHHSLPSTEAMSTPHTPWGVLPLIGFSFTLFMIQVFFVLLVVALISFLSVEWTIMDILHSQDLVGVTLSIEAITSLFCVLPFLFLFASLRKGYPLHHYLGLNTVPWKTTLKWVALLLLIITIEDMLLYFVNNRIVDEFMITIYETSYSPWILFFAVVIAAPIVEEFYFRSFLFETIRFTRLGDWGAIVFTSVFWALVHVQYDWLGVLIILIGGMILGLARIKTQSIYVPIILHMVMNFVATCELLIVVQG